MSDRSREGDGPVPDSDPHHLDPAGEFAGRIEDGEIDMQLADDTDREDLREFVARAEAGEFGADPGVEANVRIARALLDRPAADHDPDGAEGEGEGDEDGETA